MSSGGSSSGEPRVYLRLHSKRPRDGFTEDAPESRYVRLRWSSEEMGPAPAQLQRATAARTTCVFRRLPRPSTATTTAAAVAAPSTTEAPPSAPTATTGASRAGETGVAPPSRTHVTRLTQAGRCLVIDCAADATATVSSSSSPAAAALYVLDAAASEREAMHDAFGEFAITDNVADETTALKRERDADDMADVVLAPVRRLALQQDHASARQRENAVCADGPGASHWGPVEADVAGTTWAMLQAHDALLCVEGAGEAAADLYCYPDHRKDDEYDSNAEDFSGNDYPDDADDDEAAGVDSDSSTGRQRCRGYGRSYEGYGMFCEEGYSERSLSSGWGSSDDEG